MYQSTARNLTRPAVDRVLAQATADATGQDRRIASSTIIESGESPRKKFGLRVVREDGSVYTFGDFPPANQQPQP